MNVKIFLAIAAAISVLYGIAFVVVPESVGALFAVPPEAHNILTSRYFGATLLALGLAFWFVRETSDQTALRGLLMALAVGSIVGAIISIWGTVAGTVNAMGWSSVLIYVALLAGCAYYLFADRTVAGPR